MQTNTARTLWTTCVSLGNVGKHCTSQKHWQSSVVPTNTNTRFQQEIRLESNMRSAKRDQFSSLVLIRGLRPLVGFGFSFNCSTCEIVYRVNRKQVRTCAHLPTSKSFQELLQLKVLAARINPTSLGFDLPRESKRNKPTRAYKRNSQLFLQLLNCF